MKVAVFGLGYVGSVTAVAFASEGHQVIGVDVDAIKLELLGAGRSPIREPGLDERLPGLLECGALELTAEVEYAMDSVDLAFVCVGTPSEPDGRPSLDALERVTRNIGRALHGKERYLSVVYRSTVLPGTVEEKLLPWLEEASGRRCGKDFGVGFNPEFMREGRGLEDFYRPARLVIGELDARTADRLVELYAFIDAPRIREAVALAEMIKYADNAFHSLKIAFANEIGSLAHASGVDPQRLMEAFCLDTRLNISAAYLRPGFAFGGSCLPKDLRALAHLARGVSVETPILDGILPGNAAHLERALKRVLKERRGRVGIIGLSFKEETDDLRESPALELAVELRKNGVEIRIFDPRIRRDALFGANLAHLEERLPEIWEWLSESADLLLEETATLVLTRPPSARERDLLRRARETHRVVDLSGTLKTEDLGLKILTGINESQP